MAKKSVSSVQSVEDHFQEFPQISQITQIAGAKNNGIHGKKICVICEIRGRQKYSRVTGIIRPLCLQSWERNPLNVKFKSKLYSLMDVSAERRSRLGAFPKLTAYVPWNPSGTNRL